MMSASSMARRTHGLLVALMLCVSHEAGAVLPSTGGAAVPSVSTTAPLAAGEALCREQLPEGHTRPRVNESFPNRVYSGFAAYLEVTVEHEAAETVMAGGNQVQLASKDASTLERLGFILPNPKGPVTMQVERNATATPPNTKVRIPVLVLAKEPENKALTLPSLPISVARANGELFTLCTSPHAVTVEDPTSSTPDPKPKANPRPLRQLEEWTALKQGFEIGTLALIAGAFLAALFFLWRRRPKRLMPLPPPRPPWDIAFEELRELRRGELVLQHRFAEHYDKASDAVRKYLGARFGFDGLESTTKELVAGLHDAHLDVGTTNAVELFLRDADLVKFANRTPTEAECWLVLDQAEGFVQTTLPRPEQPTDDYSNASPREEPNQ